MAAGETRQVIDQARQGDTEALTKLWKSIKRQVDFIVNKYSKYSEPDDLRQELYFAMLSALDNWKEEKGASFHVYVCYWLEQHAQRYTLQNNVVKLPSHINEKVYRIKRMQAEYYKQHGCRLSDKAAAYSIGLSEQQFNTIQKALAAKTVESLDSFIAEDCTYYDVIPAEEEVTDTPEHATDHAVMAGKLWAVVDTIGAEKDSLRLYASNWSIKETARQQGKPYNKTCNEIRRGLRKMSRIRYDRYFISYFDSYLKEHNLYSHGGLNSFKRTNTSAVEYFAIKSLERDTQRDTSSRCK